MHRTEPCRETDALVLLCTSLSGGIGRVVCNLAEALATQGVRIVVVVGKESAEYELPRHPLVAYHVLRTTHATFGVIAFAVLLLRVRPRAVLADMPRTAQLAWRACALLGNRIAAIACLHNTYSLTVRQLSRAKQRARMRVLRLYPRRAAAIVGVSRGVADDFADLIGIPHDAVRAIPNPAVPLGLDRLAAECLAPDDPLLARPYVLALGRLTEQKGFDVLIDAYGRLGGDDSPDLVILGEGPERASLEACARAHGLEQRVHLPGARGNPFPYIARARLLVLASRWEGFANVLVEAMALGVPVVATDCPNGPREILEGGRHGPLVPVGDAPALARAIEQVLARPANGDSLRARAAVYRADRVAREYLELARTLA